jgi:hypothetical protein
MSDDTTHPPAWHADPFGRAQLRYHDGTQWTEHVSSGGVQSVDPPEHRPPPPPSAATQVANSLVNEHDAVSMVQGTAGWQGGGHLLNEPILVVSQKAQLFEVNQEYAIRGHDGQVLGYIRQVGQSQAKQVMRVLTNFDQYMTHHLDIFDVHHNFLLRVTRPAKFMKSKVIVQNAQLQEIGQIVQKNVIGKIRFDLVVGDHLYGSINAENWRAWNFRIDDHTGTEIARITKTWEGIAKNLFTTADNYVVHIHRPLEDPLRSLVVASSASVDVALKQQDRGII